MGTAAERGPSSRSSEPAHCRTPPAEAAGAEAGGGRGAPRGAGGGCGRPARPALEGRATGPGPQVGRCGLSQEGSTVPALWAQSGQVRHKMTHPTAHGTRATGHGPRVQAGDVGGARGTERGRREHRRHQGAPGRARRPELCPIGVRGHGLQLPVVAVSLLPLSGSLREPRQGARQGISQDSLWACTLQHGRGTPAPEPAQRRADGRRCVSRHRQTPKFNIAEPCSGTLHVNSRPSPTTARGLGSRAPTGLAGRAAGVLGTAPSCGERRRPP